MTTSPSDEGTARSESVAAFHAALMTALANELDSRESATPVQEILAAILAVLGEVIAMKVPVEHHLTVWEQSAEAMIRYTLDGLMLEAIDRRLGGIASDTIQ